MIEALTVWVGAVAIAFFTTVGAPTPVADAPAPTPEPVAETKPFVINPHGRHLHALTPTKTTTTTTTTLSHCEAVSSCCSCK